MLSADTLWITALIERGRSVVDHPFVASLLVLGWIPLVTSGIVFFGSSSTELSFVIIQLLTASIVVLGPYQAYKYDTNILPEFFDDVEELIADQDLQALRKRRRHYLKHFRVKHIPFVLLWTAAVVSVLPLNASYFADQGLVFGTPLYFVYVIFLLDFGVLSGLGLFSVLITIRSIQSIATLSITIEPLHPDGLGGLSVFGTFAIWSTLLISNGALAIPLSIEMVTTPFGAAVVYSGISFYVLLILTSFVYPTVKINRKAQQIRESHLEQYRQKIRELETEITEVTSKSQASTRELCLRMEIERARKEFQNYRDVRLYPLSVGIFVRLLSSVLLPVGFTLFEFFLPQIL